MEITDNLRLRIVRKAMKKTQDEVADAIKMARQSYGNLEKGKVRIQDKHLELLKMEFPEVNTDYIRTGQGDPLLPLGTPPINIGDSPKYSNNREQITHTYDESHTLKGKKTPDSPNSIPFYIKKPPKGAKYSDIMEQATDRVSIPIINGYSDFGTVVRDKALIGLYEYGCHIYAQEKDKLGYMAYGSVYLVCVDGLEYVRRVQKHPNEKEYIILRADEEKRWRYEDIDVRREDIEYIGIAVAAMEINQAGRERAA